jgi:c-di-GMP-binding flagellar brake protein YcgR
LPDEDVQVRLGMPLKAEMFCGKDRYTFYTRIGSIFGETWFLELPYSIERADRRAATRIKVLGDPGYRMDITNKHHVTLMAVTDISYTGIGLLGDPAVTKLSIGDTLIGTLHLPTYSIAIQLDIQNIHPGNNNNGLHIYGCKIGKISDEDRRALIKLLLQLRPDAR